MLEASMDVQLRNFRFYLNYKWSDLILLRVSDNLQNLYFQLKGMVRNDVHSKFVPT